MISPIYNRGSTPRVANAIGIAIAVRIDQQRGHSPKPDSDCDHSWLLVSLWLSASVHLIGEFSKVDLTDIRDGPIHHAGL